MNEQIQPDLWNERGLNILLEISRRLTAPANLESLWKHIVQNAIDISQANSGSLYFFSDPSNPAKIELKFRMSKGEAESKKNRAEARKIAIRAWSAVEPFMIPLDQEIMSGQEEQLQDFILAIPIRTNNAAAGVLILERTVRPFSQEEAEFINLIASLAGVALHHNQVVKSEQEQRKLAEALRDSAEALTSTLSLDEVLDRILKDLKTVVHHDAAHMMLIEDGIAQVVRCTGYAEIGFEEMLLSRKFKISEIPHLRAFVERKEPVTISSTRNSPEWTNLPEVSWIRSYAGAPIRIREKVIGFLGVDSGTPGFFSEKDSLRLRAFADQAAIALENARLYEHIQHLARTDELTGLLNRRGLLEDGEKELARCLRYGNSLAAILVDIDNFKEINDQYGHPVGDQLLQRVANHIKNQVRGFDLVARMGGDEIFILLPETTADQAAGLAERIRSSIESLPLMAGNTELSITLSLGVHAISAEKENLLSLFMKTDQALYQAKQAGRNRVAIKKD